MVTDGRDCHIHGLGPLIVDGVDKLQPIAERVFAVPFGVAAASADAIDIMREEWDEPQDPAPIGEMLDRAVAKAWDRFYSNLDPAIDRSDPRLGVGVLIAGVAGPTCEPFVCESIHSERVTIPANVGRGSCIIAVRGGEEQGALGQFKEAAESIIRDGSWEEEKGPHNALTQALTEAAADTIEAAAQENPQIGWPIRSVIVRCGFPVLKEALRWK